MTKSNYNEGLRIYSCQHVPLQNFQGIHIVIHVTQNELQQTSSLNCLNIAYFCVEYSLRRIH